MMGVLTMDEYIEREDLKERFRKRLEWLKKDVHDEYSGALLDGCECDMDLIDEIPTVDAVPVVRCKNCKNWIPGGYKSIDDPQNPQCGGRCWYSVIPRFENDFCSYGKRKEKKT